jgi:hypothetical protein
MAALTADTPIIRSIGNEQTIPAAAAKIYGGSMIGIQTTGYGRSFVLGDRFAGHLLNGVDNSLGAAGDKQLVTNRGMYCLLCESLTATLANVAAKAPVYALDGGTLSLTEGQRVGRVVNRNSNGYAIVEFDTESDEFVIAETVTQAEFTDNAGTATGYVDLATALPAGVSVSGWQAVVTTGFTGDTTAVMQVGVSGNVDRFTQVTSGSVLAAGTIGSDAPAVSGDPSYIETATTVRVTVTGGADFTSISAGSMTVIVFCRDLRRE